MSFASGGRAALQQLAEKPFDVIVSDLRMPGMDGDRLLNQVKKDYPQMVRIILSGQTTKESFAKAIPIAHQFLSKPCDAKILESAVERARSLK